MRQKKQGQQSRSGRPGDYRTNIFTEMVSLTFHLQARNTHIVCTGSCPHSLSAKENWGELKEQADFEHGGHTFLTGVAWNRIQTKCRNLHRVSCAAFSQVRLKPLMPMDIMCVDVK